MNDEDCISVIEEVFEFCCTIERRVSKYDITEASIAVDPDHADLILMPLCQIGESVQNARANLETRYPEVPWHRMAGLRNVIVHGYTKVDPSIIYSTVIVDIPKLKAFCQEVLGYR